MPKMTYQRSKEKSNADFYLRGDKVSMGRKKDAKGDPVTVRG
jgi:hypothetical protein